MLQEDSSVNAREQSIWDKFSIPHNHRIMEVGRDLSLPPLFEAESATTGLPSTRFSSSMSNSKYGDSTTSPDNPFKCSITLTGKLFSYA